MIIRVAGFLWALLHTDSYSGWFWQCLCCIVSCGVIVLHFRSLTLFSAALCDRIVVSSMRCTVVMGFLIY